MVEPRGWKSYVPGTSTQFEMMLIKASIVQVRKAMSTTATGGEGALTVDTDGDLDAFENSGRMLEMESDYKQLELDAVKRALSRQYLQNAFAIFTGIRENTRSIPTSGRNSRWLQFKGSCGRKKFQMTAIQRELWPEEIPDDRNPKGVVTGRNECLNCGNE